MKILKLIIYCVIIVALFVFTALIFKAHPEMQLAFIIPGLFIFVYSKIRDEVYVSLPARLRMAKGK